MSPIRCTQNPTMGEEWRRGWHPEYAPTAQQPGTVLVVGAGPAGLEIARTLGHRDCGVALLEAGRELGGRVRRESALPGLAAWIRVVDYREQQLGKLDSVEIHRQSPVSVDDVLNFGFAHVVISTGATWRADGVGRWNHHPIPIAGGANVLTPDDIMSGARPSGSRVVIFDDDHYYMAGVLAELLAAEGFEITVVCAKPQVSAWTSNTLEVDRIQARLINAGVALHNNQALVAVDGDAVTVQCAYTGAESVLAAESVVLVTARKPNNDPYQGLDARVGEWHSAGVHSVRRIGEPMRHRPSLPRYMRVTRPGVSSNALTGTRHWRSGARSRDCRMTSRSVGRPRAAGPRHSICSRFFSFQFTSSMRTVMGFPPIAGAMRWVMARTSYR
jgi:dimethylamine/trimethylamine dehydrogenase